MLTEDIQGRECCLPLAEGLEFDLIRPGDNDAEALDLSRIAKSLHHQYRWLGHGRRSPLTVLEHTMHVTEIVQCLIRLQGQMPRVGMQSASVINTVTWASLHDVHEELCGDIPRPVARALTVLAGGDYVQQLKDMLDERVMRHFGIDRDEVDFSLVKQADDLMCAWEAQQLGLTTVRWTFDVDSEFERIMYLPLSVSCFDRQDLPGLFVETTEKLLCQLHKGLK